MATYYLIVGDEVRQEIVRAPGDVTAIPVLPEAQAVSLLNRKHFLALKNRLGLTVPEVLDRLGLVDKRPVV